MPKQKTIQYLRALASLWQNTMFSSVLLGVCPSNSYLQASGVGDDIVYL